MSTQTAIQSSTETSIRPESPPGPAGVAETIASIGGRALLAALFLIAGVAKIASPTPFLEHMAQFGVPAFLLPAVIGLELSAGVAVLIGWRLREAAGALGIFCLLTATIFHHQLWIKPELTLFLKDLAIAGGLLLLAGNATERRRTQGLGRA